MASLRPLFATGALLFTCALWALSFPVARSMTLLVSERIPGADLLWFTQAVLFIRFSLAALLLGLCTRWREGKLIRSEVEQGVGLGLFTGLGMILQMDGLAHSSGSVCAFLSVASCVVFVPIAHSVIERRWPGTRVVICCLMVLAGIALISNFSLHDLRLGRGETESLASGFLFTGQVIWVERPQFAQNRAGPATVLMFAVMSLTALPGAVLGAPPGELLQRYAALPEVWAVIAFLICVCTLLTFPIMNAWQRHVGATAAGLIYCAEPVLAGLYCTLLPALLARWMRVDYANEVLSAEFLFGALLITVANVALQWRR